VQLFKLFFKGLLRLIIGSVYIKECINYLKFLYYLKGRYFFPALRVERIGLSNIVITI
jgi:hypothetical protein